MENKISSHKNRLPLLFIGIVLGILLTIIIVISAGLLRQQPIQIPLAYKEQCEKDGTAWVKDNPYPGTQIDEYAYSPSLNTCLIYEEDGYSSDLSQKMIYDLYDGKVIAQCPDPLSTTTTCTELNNYIAKYFQ